MTNYVPILRAEDSLKETESIVLEKDIKQIKCVRRKKSTDKILWDLRQRLISGPHWEVAIFQ